MKCVVKKYCFFGGIFLQSGLSSATRPDQEINPGVFPSYLPPSRNLQFIKDDLILPEPQINDLGNDLLYKNLIKRNGFAGFTENFPEIKGTSKATPIKGLFEWTDDNFFSTRNSVSTLNASSLIRAVQVKASTTCFRAAERTRPSFSVPKAKPYSPVVKPEGDKNMRKLCSGIYTKSLTGTLESAARASSGEFCLAT